MPTLRLFARFREIAGTDLRPVDGGTVGDILDGLSAEYGDAFDNALKAAGIWVNGTPAERSSAVGPDDEIALIPPVSGGTYATETRPATTSIDPMEGILSVVVLAALLIATWVPLEWFVVISVGAALAWMWDLAEAAHDESGDINLYAALPAAPLAGAATYAWGFAGFAGSVAAAVAIAVFWPIFEAKRRDLSSVAITAVTAVIVAAGTGTLVLLRLSSTATAPAFVLIVAAAIVAAQLTSIYGGQAIDPNIGILVGAIIAGLIAGAVTTQIALATGLFAAVAVAAGLIAGRVFGSMARSGTILYTVRARGQLSPLDGLWLAAPLFWLALTLLG